MIGDFPDADTSVSLHDGSAETDTRGREPEMTATTTTSSTDKAPVKVPPPLLFLIPFLIGVALQLTVPIRLLPLGWVQLAAGLPLVVMGLALSLTAVRTLVGAETDLMFKKSTSVILERGPYRLSRNPIYLGASVMYIRGTIAVNSVWPLALFPVAVLLVLFRAIHPEERYLESKFGQPYRDYKSAVRRWL